jgi:hypothetical protein
VNRVTSGAARQAHGEFARARARAELDATIMRGRAVRTVAEQAVDAADLHSLLSMLGLEESDGMSTLRSGLSGYVRAVAAAVRVPPEATGFELSDTATAYLGLTERWVLRPGRDLMLVWTERHGWAVAVETDPAELPVVVGYLGGGDVVPDPYTVARFVTGVVSGRRAPVMCPNYSVGDNRDELAERLNRYAKEPGGDLS